MTMHRKHLIAVAVGVTSLGLGASPALAATSCAGTTTTTTFSAWGDPNQYIPFKGSSFESGASGWSWLNKANITVGDDNSVLPGVIGSHAVELPAGGTAKSPWTCVDSTRPSLRFFFRRLSGTGNLTVSSTVSGLMTLTTVASFSGDGSWEPSPIVTFPQVMTDLTAGTAINAQFQFTADPGTVYRIDDIYLDPFKPV
jgi:hypothetical protein